MTSSNLPRNFSKNPLFLNVSQNFYKNCHTNSIFDAKIAWCNFCNRVAREYPEIIIFTYKSSFIFYDVIKKLKLKYIPKYVLYGHDKRYGNYNAYVSHS